jgi:CRISPR-associated protein Cmr2
MTDWKRKLVAFLHDPPQKPRATAAHEDQRQSFLNRLGLDPNAFEEFERRNDWQAASADRLVFPDHAKSGLRVDWKANDYEFRHPLGGGRLTPRQFPATAAVMEEAFVSALDGISPDSEDWKLKFIRSWRLWPERSAREKAAHLAYIVADTRIPDHTLWHHNALTAAFTAAAGKQAFLLFQIGPVKDFIAQARKTQDLWSASYLLSFLIAKAMLAVADEIGPDSIVYPQLRGAPLADWHWRELLGGDDEKPPLRASHSNELLTPNLPNRFLALIPAGERGEELARLAEKAVRNSWGAIAKSVRDFIAQRVDSECPGWDLAWAAQVARFPVVDWVVHDWSNTKTALEQAAKKTPPLSGGWDDHALRHAFLWSTQMIPPNEREKYGPNSNSGFAWALHYAVTDWKLAARKNARTFASWTKPGQPVADGVPKDHLDGRNEALGGSHHKEFREILNRKFPNEFKGSQLYGALSAIKRLWPRSYLGGERENGGLSWADWKPKFDSVQDIAKAIDREESETPQGKEPKYYAVLCMDGDDMGQWLSGVKAAPLVGCLAEQAADYFRAHWQPGANLPLPDSVQRPLSPGYHASLSEALANFSLYCAGSITRAFDGQLLYAGGDDVVAMVPATNALDCAQALQLAFRGINPDPGKARASEEVKRVLQDIFDYTHHAEGFITLRRSARGDVGRGEHLKPNWPLMMMGPLATASVGIAIGHVRSPMQDTIQAARDAEHAAKSVPGKGAFCLSILKRSGEAVSFAAKWDSGVPAVWSELNAGVHNLSSRFAYRFAQLVAAQVVEGGSAEGAGYVKSWNDHEKLADIVEAELTHVLKKQGGKAPPKARELAKFWRDRLIGDDAERPALSPHDFLHFWTAWAFVRRQSEPDANSES